MTHATHLGAPDDPTRVLDGSDREWLPIPAADGAFIKVLVADPERHQVVFQFRFEPGTVLPPHTHHCQAIAYTISGHWEYEGLELPAGTVAYEPLGSVHAPSSEPGAELLVCLLGTGDRFLENHMPDGSTFEMDMAFFRAIDGITAAQAAMLPRP